MASGTTEVRLARLRARPANAYGAFDSEPLALVPVQTASRSELAGGLALAQEAVEALVRARAARPLTSMAELRGAAPAVARALGKARHRLIFAQEQPLAITDVTADPAHLLSDRPFRLEARYINGGDEPIVLISATVRWQGEPFVNEVVVDAEQAAAGVVSLAFDRERTLPVGPAEFTVTLYRRDGAAARFVKTFFVLPSNPLSLSLAPAGATVTGTWSAHGDHDPGTDSFVTGCQVTIANGDPGPVAMSPRVEWSFWDGPVGTGTLIESGAFDWPGAMSVGGNGLWQGTVTFTSPPGSGVHGVYRRKEDMTISIAMTARDGRRIAGEITARTMLAFGVNIIKVGDFGSQEHADLYAAVDRCRQIYEQRDMTFRGVDRRIISSAQAGGHTVIDNETEFRGLLSDWSVPNDFVDVYICQDFNWSTYNGYAGDTPGPAAKGGNRDGVAVEKTGYTNASGTRRLDVATLAQLIGHEIGHYLGLPHLETANNLMRGNTGVRGPDLSYDQYRTMLPHAYIVFE